MIYIYRYNFRNVIDTISVMYIVDCRLHLPLDIWTVFVEMP